MSSEDSFRSMAGIYDRYRSLDRQVFEILVSEIKELMPTQKKLLLLDVGCGTGTYSIALAEVLNIDFTGIDISKEMLEEATKKCPEGKWLHQRIEDADFGDESFDIILISFVIQHLDYKDALSKAYRFLKKPCGKLLIVTDDHDQFLKGRTFHRYIPRLLEIDLARFPKVDELRSYLKEIGFTTHIHKTRRETRIMEDDVRGLIERGKARYISTLTLITDEELSIGLEKMEKGLIEELKVGPITGIREKTIIVATPYFDA